MVDSSSEEFVDRLMDIDPDLEDSELVLTKHKSK